MPVRTPFSPRTRRHRALPKNPEGATVKTWKSASSRSQERDIRSNRRGRKFSLPLHSGTEAMPDLFGERSRGSGSRTPSCSPPRRRRNRRPTSSGPSRRAGAEWSRRRSACTRWSTSAAPRRCFCGPTSIRPPLDAQAPRNGAPLLLELGAHLRQDARLVGAADRPDQEGSTRERSSSRRSWRAPAATPSSRTGRRSRRRARTRAPDALELNLSCPHMDRQDMGSNIGKDRDLVSVVAQVVREVARVPIWAKLTPSTTDIVLEARAAFLGGADAISSSNTFTSLPLVDPETLEFEVNVDGLVSTGGLGGPAILPLSLAKMAQMTPAFPDRSFSGIGGIATFAHALNYFLLGCGTVQVCTAAMLDRAVGPNVIRAPARRLRGVSRAPRGPRLEEPGGLPRSLRPGGSSRSRGSPGRTPPTTTAATSRGRLRGSGGSAREPPS